MIRLVVARLCDADGSNWRIPVGRGSLTMFETSGDEIRLCALPEGDDVD
jgi:sugar lactone lactonase YvrE